MREVSWIHGGMCFHPDHVRTHRSRSHQGLRSHGPGCAPGPHSQAEISPHVNLHVRVLIVSGATSGVWPIPLEH